MPNPDHSQTTLARLLIRIGRGLQRVRLRGFAAFALGPTQRDAIVIVAAIPGLTQAALARQLGVDRAMASRLVRRLVATGVLDYERVGDRRSKGLLRLTDYGRAFLPSISDESDHLESVVGAQLSEEELRVLRSLLQRTVVAVDHVLTLPPDGEIPPPNISGILGLKGL